MEKKQLTAHAEFKTLDDQGQFEGYGSVFGNVDSYNEIVEPGAFTKSLSKFGLPALLWQHDTSRPIGKYIETREDSRGLFVRGQLNQDVQLGREAFALLKQGALKGLSIGYRVRKDSVNDKGVRHLKEVDLMEVSVVTFPANDAANITATRSKPETIREFEEHLREVGYSASHAKHIASKGWVAYNSEQQREVSAADNSILASLEKLNQTLRGV